MAYLNNRSLFLSAALSAALMAASSSAIAGNNDTRNDHLVFGVGYFDVFDNHPRDEAADFRVEYRFDYSMIESIEDYVEMKPWIGGEFTSDGAAYGVAGILFEVELTDWLLFTPNVGVGLYHEGAGKNMGHIVEFRSTAEFQYRFEDDSRVGLSLGHISNAEMGDTNHGAEIVNISYHIPTSYLTDLMSGW